MPKVLFVISHNMASSATCCTRCRPASTASTPAPTCRPSWAGLRDADLAAVTGVPDAGFCHNGRFIAAAKSYEGIYAMALQALKEVEQLAFVPAKAGTQVCVRYDSLFVRTGSRLRGDDGLSLPNNSSARR